MSKTVDALDELGKGFLGLLTSFLTSRTTYIAALGFIAVYLSSGRIEAFQQLLAYLGIGGVWILKMGVQNVVGIVKNGGKDSDKVVDWLPQHTIPAYQSVDTVKPGPISPVPYVDTMPDFSEEDDKFLSVQQKQTISEWYTRAVTIPPAVPDIPKKEAVLYMDVMRRDEQRRAQAGWELIQQALEAFPQGDLVSAYKDRKDCDPMTWHRVNQHWNLATDRWITYGMALWEYSDL